MRNFDPAQFVAPKDVKKMDPFIHYGIGASIDALADAGLQPHEHDAERIGVAVGAGIGGIHTIERTSIIYHDSGQVVSESFNGIERKGRKKGSVRQSTTK